MPILCECGLDLERVRGVVDLAQEATLKESLTCPACGQAVAIGDRWAAAGVLTRQTEGGIQICRWRALAGSSPTEIRWGALTVKLPALTVLDPLRVCFSAVPRFQDRNGKEVVPDHPVRPEYLDLLVEGVAWTRLQAPPGRYKVKLQFKAMSAEHVADLPVKDGPGGAIAGLRVAVWPDVDLPSWKTYLVGAWIADAKPLGNAQVHVVPVGGQGKGMALGAGALRGVRLLEGRPSVVAVSIGPSAVEGAQRVAHDTGGCFRVRPVAPSGPPPPAVAFQMGMDFGTSNTYVTVCDPQGKTRPLTWKSLDLSLIDGPIPDRGACPETWPLEGGFGEKRCTYPSAIMTAAPTADGNLNAEHWRLGEDFGLAAAISDAKFPEVDHLVTDLKWGPRYSKGLLENFAARTRYLESLLLLTVANLVKDKSMQFGSLQLKWSYPLVFERDGGGMLKSQEAAFQQAVRTVNAATGVRMEVTQGTDEATAASQAVQPPSSADDMLLVDVGGGTVDVAYLEKSTGTRRIHALSSYKFAGNDVLEMLKKKAFLQVTPEQFLGRIRNIGTLQNAHAQDLFGANVTFARTRIQVFFQYLIEHMARLIVARLLDGTPLKAKEEGIYQVSILALGNAWQFLGLTPGGVHVTIKNAVNSRVGELLQAEASRGLQAPVPTVVVDCVPSQLHPKEVVAHGLLASDGAQVANQNRGGCLGLATRVGQVHFPWFTPVLADADWSSDPRRGQFPTPSSGAYVRWRAADDPGFAKLESPLEIDGDLQQNHDAVEQEVFAGQSWFVKSAYESALELVIRPRLHTLTFKVGG